MTEPRAVHGVRILTTEEIQALSPHGFRDYRRKALRVREHFHRQFKAWDDPPTPTEQDVHDIRTLDWLCQEVKREYERRKDADWERRSKLDPDNPARKRTPMSRFSKVE